jgi:glutamate/aspartate transport system substrate-binding protein
MRRIIVGLSSLLLLVASAGEAARADTLDMIRSRGAMIIGYRDAAPPFSAMGPDKRPQGYSIDLCNRIADSVKLALDMPKLDIRYVPVTADNRIDKLEAGDIDIECGTTTRTLSRQQRADFTLFTFLSGTEMLVPAGSSIHGPLDLANKKIVLQSSTTTETVVRRLLALRLIKAEVIPVQTPQEGLATLESGKADAYASDEVVLMGLQQGAKNPGNLRLSGTLLSYEPYALMVRKNDAAFRVVADRTLALIFQSGDIVTIYRRWFGQWHQDPPPLIEALFAIESLGP